jgi:hypothetical protein
MFELSSLKKAQFFIPIFRSEHQAKRLQRDKRWSQESINVRLLAFEPFELFAIEAFSKARKLVQSIRRERARGKNGYCKQQSYCSNDRSHLARIIRALLLPARLYAHLVFGFARGPCIILHACALLVAAYLAAVQRGRRLLGKRHSAAEKQQGSET